MYNEIQYWNKRKNPNSKEGSCNLPVSFLCYIKKHLEGCNYVLEFGPGVGRVFAAYGSLKQIECFDITNRHLATLTSAARNYNFKMNFTLGHEVGVTPYKNKEFDATVVCQVLLHQKPQNINRVMKELLRISNKVIVVSWRENGKPIGSGGYCFNYDYLKICNDVGWQTFDVRYDSKHIYFVYAQK